MIGGIGFLHMKSFLPDGTRGLMQLVGTSDIHRVAELKVAEPSLVGPRNFLCTLNQHPKAFSI